MALTPIAVGSYVRFNISGKPPPELAAAVNVNSAWVVTAIRVDSSTGDARGAMLTLARQGQVLPLPVPSNFMVAVLAPPTPI